MKKYFSRAIVFLMLAFVGINWLAFAAPVTSIKDWSFNKQYVGSLPDVPWTNSATDAPEVAVKNVLDAIKNVINWVLWLLGLIALIILIYTWVKMLFNSGDDKAIEEGYKVIKNIFIAILFIGWSWLIVQFIFYVISLFVGSSTGPK